MQIRACLGIAALFLAACAPLPQRAGMALEQKPSPNFDERRPNFVILHYTTNTDAERALRTLTDPLAKVSAHYLIGRDGKIYQLVDERARAWHAGVSYWGGARDVNSASIGIELDNDGEEPFAEPEIAALLSLLADIKERYVLPAANFLGHADVAPRRKLDPGRRFPWQRLAAGGFGLWCEPPFAPAPRGADDALMLAAFGYDVSDPAAAISAFKTHFVPDGNPNILTDDDRALLSCLIGRKQETPTP